jgi:shikimate kinase
MAHYGTVVWLRADPAVLADRVRNGTHRPLLAEDPEGTLRTLAAERSELYEGLADVVVDTAGRPPDDIVEQLRGLVA